MDENSTQIIREMITLLGIVVTTVGGIVAASKSNLLKSRISVALITLAMLAMIIILGIITWRISRGVGVIPDLSKTPVVVTPSTQQPFQGIGQVRMVLASKPDGSDYYAIYLALINGTTIQQLQSLTHDLADNFDPSWSPNANSIVFLQEIDGYDQIYIMNADGRESRRITYYAGNDGTPAWSPDGKRIAFQRTVGHGLDIYIMNVDGTNMVNLTQSNLADNAPVLNQYPTWSPDGSQIAFQSNRDGQMAVFILDVSSKIVMKRLTDPALLDAAGPAWSPDGFTIAFTGMVGNQRDIFLVPSDGSSSAHPCVSTPQAEWSPNWSSDGRFLAVHVGEGKHQIAILDCEKRIVESLIINNADNLSPAWAPK